MFSGARQGGIPAGGRLGIPVNLIRSPSSATPWLACAAQPGAAHAWPGGAAFTPEGRPAMRGSQPGWGTRSRARRPPPGAANRRRRRLKVTRRVPAPPRPVATACLFPRSGTLVAGNGGHMQTGQDKPETYHLTCMVCGALPGTTCIGEGAEELSEVHPSRRLTIAERNWRTLRGWEPPELVEKRRQQRAQESAQAALYNPQLGRSALRGPAWRSARSRRAAC